MGQASEKGSIKDTLMMKDIKAVCRAIAVNRGTGTPTSSAALPDSSMLLKQVDGHDNPVTAASYGNAG